MTQLKNPLYGDFLIGEQHWHVEGDHQDDDEDGDNTPHDFDFLFVLF